MGHDPFTTTETLTKDCFFPNTWLKEPKYFRCIEMVLKYFSSLCLCTVCRGQRLMADVFLNCSPPCFERVNWTWSFWVKLDWIASKLLVPALWLQKCTTISSTFSTIFCVYGWTPACQTTHETFREQPLGSLFSFYHRRSRN